MNNNPNFNAFPTKQCKYCKLMIPAAAKICPNCRKNQDNTGKWVAFGVIVFIVLLVAFASTVSKLAPNESKTSAPESTESADSVQKVEKVEETGLTEDKYNQIETGMSYEEVVSIIGEEGTNVSESEIAGINTVVYTWKPASGFANAEIIFQDNKVVNKTQIGVASGDDVEITMDQYNSIETGMTYEEVVDLIGGEGSLLSETDIAGYNTKIYMWNGTSIGANANVTFSDGKVIAKAQYGLK